MYVCVCTQSMHAMYGLRCVHVCMWSMYVVMCFVYVFNGFMHVMCVYAMRVVLCMHLCR